MNLDEFKELKKEINPNLLLEPYGDSGQWFRIKHREKENIKIMIQLTTNQLRFYFSTNPIYYPIYSKYSLNRVGSDYPVYGLETDYNIKPYTLKVRSRDDLTFLKQVLKDLCELS